ALVYATTTLLRGLLNTHRLVWRDVRGAKVTPTSTLRLLGLLLCYPVAAGAVGAVLHAAVGPGIAVEFLSVSVYVAVWVFITLYLPHRSASWKVLIPGALMVGVGFWVLHAAAAYLLGPYAIAKQGTYGVFGAAAALLFGLYLLGRLIVFGAVLDATLWER